MRLLFFFSIAALLLSSCTKVLFTEPQTLGQKISITTPDFLKNRTYISTVNEEGNADTIRFSADAILLTAGKKIPLASSSDSFQLYVNGSFGLFNYRDVGATEWEVLVVHKKDNGDVFIYYPWHSWDYQNIDISADQNIHKKGQLTLEECRQISNDSTNLVARLTNDGSYQYLFDMSSPTASVTWEELKPKNKKAASQLKKFVAQAKKENEDQAKIQEEEAANCQSFYNHLYKKHGGDAEYIWAILPHLAYDDPSRGYTIKPHQTDSLMSTTEEGMDTLYLVSYYYELVKLKKDLKNMDYFSYAMENIIPESLANELSANHWIYYDVNGLDNTGYSNELVAFDAGEIKKKLKDYLRFTEPVEWYSPDCIDPENGGFSKKALKNQLKEFKGRTVGQ
jgi:hypothetical protein